MTKITLGWMMKQKHYSREKNWPYQRQSKSSNIDYGMLKAILTDILNAVNSFKFRYNNGLAKKTQGNSRMTTKISWSILKTFANGTKIPLILPLLIDNQFVTHLLEKANLYNNIFSQHYTTKVNNSSIPTNLTFETENRPPHLNSVWMILSKSLKD